MAPKITIGALLGVAALGGWCAVRPDGSGDGNLAVTLDARFSTQVRPFVDRYCVRCHGAKKPEASLDLSRDTTLAAVGGHVRNWERVLERLEAKEMPPEDASRQPKAEERAAAAAWVREFLDREAERTAGDPGPVLARRLSNAEYDYTVRDLTGVDIRPTRDFPVDPANEAGFDNSGEALAMSPALLKKYLAAARLVADHVVLSTDGFAFAPHPVVTDPDRDKYCVSRIVEFYERHKVDYSDYFLAAWRNRHRAAFGKPQATLGEFAAEAHISPKYLETLWSLLQDAPAEGPVGEVQSAWRKLSAELSEPDARKACVGLREMVVRLRTQYGPRVERLAVKGISEGSQPFILWRNRQLGEQHQHGGDDPATERFCRVFPDAFIVSERAPYYDPGSSPKGRLLSAGFHLMHGYFRDDGPLCDLVLNDNQRRELEALWEELNLVTLSPMRQYKDFIFFERAEPPRFMIDAEFDYARSEDKDATSPAKMDRLARAYLAKARKNEASPTALQAIETYFTDISAEIRRVERSRLAAEPSHLAALARFAERAFRRPLSPAERDDLVAFYRSLRDKDGLGHDDALRDTLVSVLMSPHFCYRVDVTGPGPGVRPLSNIALASRLSYFLWSSMPDEELLARAAAGDLHRPDVLTAQARRMLGDPRVRGLAAEFAGNWLDFRRFEDHNGVDRERFPAFTSELRSAMFEEPVRFFIDMAQRNRPVLDLVYGTDVFVNRPLARHYGMPEPTSAGDWLHIEDVRPFGRGGLLPMAVFLIKNAPGLRTSPVKRGNWVVRRLLGEQIPPPPPTVPELPKDEANLGELSLPQLLARHRADKNCAPCHRRFDSVGLAFEGFGPVGECRTRDLGGRPVQTAATFPDGSDRDGLDGLRAYLREKRQGDFVANLCRKLLAYALGRSLQLSDRKVLSEMQARLAVDGYKFGSLVETIVASPQFLNQHGRDDPRGE